MQVSHCKATHSKCLLIWMALTRAEMGGNEMSLIKVMNKMPRGMTHTCRTVIPENKTLLNQSLYMLGFLSICKKMFFAVEVSYRLVEVMPTPVTKGNLHVYVQEIWLFFCFLCRVLKGRKKDI